MSLHHKKHHHSKSKKVLKNIIFPAVLLAGIAAMILGIITINHAFARADSGDISVVDTSLQFTVPAEVPTDTRDAATKHASQKSSYICPVDFEELKEDNPDIYAWITVPGTNIDYPVLRREGDDTYYLNHDQELGYSIAGALYTETEFNGPYFDDPVTVIYGHRMNDDTMFGMLQSFYSSSENLENYGTIYVFTPERGFKYKIFAAVPHSDAHLLYGMDYSQPRNYRILIDDILNTNAYGAAFDPSYAIDYDDDLLILSTCYKGNITRRFLVCAYLDETIV